MADTVYFRFFEERDLDCVYHWMNNSGLNGFGIEPGRKICKDSVQNWIKERMHDNRFTISWAICSSISDVPIGFINLKEIHYINRTAKVGSFFIAEDISHNQDIEIEAFSFLLDYTFERLNMQRLTIDIVEGDNYLNKLVSSFMFVREGVLRQAFFSGGNYKNITVFSLLSPEYFVNKEKEEYSYQSVLNRICNKD